MPQYRRAKISGFTFFFTVVLADRSSALLVEQIDRLRTAYRLTRERRPFKTIAICVLPDHIHAIWSLPEGDADFSTRWSLIKSGFSRGLQDRSRSPSKIVKREKGIWQRRFWEHAIRDAADLERHVDYIHFNPVKHGHVKRVVDWPHSSFHRYVARGELTADWGGDMKEIQGSFGE
ncbi:MAG: transposase [Rhizobiales bacterium]|nr:transposase [Hyphomicrobiales bacterium]